MSLLSADKNEKGRLVPNRNQDDNDLDAAHQQNIKIKHHNVDNIRAFPETEKLERRGNVITNSVPGVSSISNNLSVNIAGYESCSALTTSIDIFPACSRRKIHFRKCLDEEDTNLEKKLKLSKDNEIESLNTCTPEGFNVNAILNKTSDSTQHSKPMNVENRFANGAAFKHNQYECNISPQTLLVSCLKCLKSQIDQDFEQNILKNFRILKDCGIRQVFDVAAIESFKRNILEMYNNVELNHTKNLQIEEVIEYGGDPYVPKYKEMFYNLLKMISISKLPKEQSVIICDIYIHFISIAVLIGALGRAVNGESVVQTGCKSLYRINVKSLLKQIDIVSHQILRIIISILKCLVKDNTKFFESDNFLTSMEMAVHPSKVLEDDSDCEIIEELSTLPKHKPSETQRYISIPSINSSSLGTNKVVEDDRKIEAQPSSTGVHAIWINSEKMVRAVERQYSEDSSDTDYNVYWSQHLFNSPSLLFNKLPTFVNCNHSINTKNMSLSKGDKSKRYLAKELVNVKDFFLDSEGLVTFKDLFRYNFDAKAWNDRADIIRNHNTFVLTDVDYSDHSPQNVTVKVESVINHHNIIDDSKHANAEHVTYSSENGGYSTTYSNDVIPSLHRLCVSVLQNSICKYDNDWEFLSACTSNTSQNLSNCNLSDQCSTDSFKDQQASSMSYIYEETGCKNDAIRKIPKTLTSICLDVCKSLLSMNRNKKDSGIENYPNENCSNILYKYDKITFNPPTLLALCTTSWQVIFNKSNDAKSELVDEYSHCNGNAINPSPLKQLCFNTVKKIFFSENEKYQLVTENSSTLASSNIRDKVRESVLHSRSPMTLVQQALIAIKKTLHYAENESVLQLDHIDNISNDSYGNVCDLYYESSESVPSENNQPAVKEEPLSDDELPSVQVKSEHNYFTEENFNRFEDEFMRNYLEESTGELIIPTIVDTNVLSARDFNNLGCDEINLKKEFLQIKKEIVEPESVEPQYLCRPIVVKKECVKREYEPDSDSEIEADSLLVEIPNKYRDESEQPSEDKRKRGRPKNGHKKNSVQPVPNNIFFQQAPTGKRFNTRSNKNLSEENTPAEDMPVETTTAEITSPPAVATTAETMAVVTTPAALATAETTVTSKRMKTRSNKISIENSLSDENNPTEDIPVESAKAVTNTAATGKKNTRSNKILEENSLSDENNPTEEILVESAKSVTNAAATGKKNTRSNKISVENSLSDENNPTENIIVESAKSVTNAAATGKKNTRSNQISVENRLSNETNPAVEMPVEATTVATLPGESTPPKNLLSEKETEKSMECSKIFEDTLQDTDKFDSHVVSPNMFRDDSDSSRNDADGHQVANFCSSSSDMDSSEEMLRLLDLGKSKKKKKRRKIEKNHKLTVEEKLLESKNELKEVELGVTVNIESVVEEKGEAPNTEIKLRDENGVYVLKDAWKIYDIRDGDTKLFELCTVPLDKLPESFAANYLMDFQQNHEEKEVNSLIDFSSLNRRTNESDVGKEDEVKSRLKKTAVKKTDMIMNKNGKYEYHKVYSESESDTEACEAKKPKILKDEKQTEVSQENEAARNCLVNSDSDNEDGTRIPKVEPVTESQNEISSAQEETVIKKDDKDSGPTFEASSTTPRSQRTSPRKGGLSNGSGSILTEKLSGTDSEEEERRWQQKKKMLTVMQRKRLQKFEEKVPKSDEDDDGKKLSTEEYKVQRARNKKRKREIRLKMEKEFMYSGGLQISQGQKLRGRSTKSKPTRGRKNIRQILDKNTLAASTKQATREEEERRQRLNQKNAKLKEVFGIDGSVNVMKIDGQLCLDYDIEESKPLVSVDSKLTEPMKHHQCEGVKFMWDACYESLARVKSGGSGGGCILAHCMGLGKTLQVIALVHTIMKIPEMRTKHVLVCCPLSTALNWVDEFHKWLGDWDQTIKVFEMSKLKKNYERCYQLEDWYKEGGVFVIGYEMFRMLTTLDPQEDDVKLSYWTKIKQTLLEPGPDVVVCDEGHLLKNDNSSLAAAMSRIATKRRITLTGTPMQNNLKEYYCMVNFVRPNLLGTYREFVNRFENPIMNGQHRDSSESDIKIMKWRSHILHNMLEGCLQRMEASVLDPYLPKKHEYVLLVTLSPCQAKMYKHFLDNFVSKCKEEKSARRCLLRDFYVLQKIWTHPRVLHLFEASFRDSGRENVIKTETELAISAMEEEMSGHIAPEVTSYKAAADAQWWLQYLDGGALLDSLQVSHKFTIVFNILDESEKLGDKTLLFSTSLFTLDALEYFLQKVRGWHVGVDYYRLDGSVPADIRQKWCRDFNTEGNKAKLFLMSTRVGSLGINMVAANRVIIFDTSWNPAHDIQSIFRVYRFGQRKECFIYRLVAMGTMEERIYERSVFKTAVSCRVVDEHQIDRHYNMADLSELYKFTDSSQLSELEACPVRVPPRDALVATLLLRCSQQLRRCHEHDSLLRNMCDEQLNEAERQQAWDQFNTEHLSKEREAEIQEENRKAAEQLRKQKSGEALPAAAGGAAQPAVTVPLHPALYDNPYFVTIVATALRTARPEMTDESAIKTAKLNLNLLKKHHLPDVYSVIHSIALRTLGEVTLRNLWSGDTKTQNSSPTDSLSQLPQVPQKSLLLTNQKTPEDMPSSSSSTTLAPPAVKVTTIKRKKLSKSIVTKTSTKPVVPNISITERPVPVEGSLVAVSQPESNSPAQVQYVYKFPAGMAPMSSKVLPTQSRLIQINPRQMGIAVPAKLVKQSDGKTVLMPTHEMISMPKNLVPVQEANNSTVPVAIPTIASAPTPVGIIRNQHSFISMDVPDFEESILPDDMPRFQNASPPPLTPINRSQSPDEGQQELAEDILQNYIRKQQQNQETNTLKEPKKTGPKSIKNIRGEKLQQKKQEVKNPKKGQETKTQQKKNEINLKSGKIGIQTTPSSTTDKEVNKPEVKKYNRAKLKGIIKNSVSPYVDDDDVYIIPDDDDDEVASQEVKISSSTPSETKNSLPTQETQESSSSISTPELSSSSSSRQIISCQTGTSIDKTELTPQTILVVRSNVDKFTSSRKKIEMLLGNTKIIRKKIGDTSSVSDLSDVQSENESTPKKIGRRNAESGGSGSSSSQVKFTRLSDKKSMSADQLKRSVPTVTPDKPLSAKQMIRNQHSFISMDVPDFEESILPDDMPRFQNASPPPLTPINRSQSPDEGQQELAEDILQNYIRKQQQNQETNTLKEPKKTGPESIKNIRREKLHQKKQEVKSQKKKQETKTQQKKNEMNLKSGKIGIRTTPSSTTDKKVNKPEVKKYTNRAKLKEIIKNSVSPYVDDDDVYIIPDDDDDEVASQEVTISSSTPSKTKNSLPTQDTQESSASISTPELSSSSSSLQIISCQTGTSIDKTKLKPQTKPVVKSNVDKFTLSRKKIEMLLGNTKIIRKKIGDTCSVSDLSDVQSENESTPKKIGRRNAESGGSGSSSSQVTFTRLSDKKSMSADQLKRSVPTVTPDKPLSAKQMPNVDVTIFKPSAPLSLENNSSIDPLAMDPDVFTVQVLKETKTKVTVDKSQIKTGITVTSIKNKTETNKQRPSSPVTSDDDLIVISPEHPTKNPASNGNIKKAEPAKLVNKPRNATTAASEAILPNANKLPAVNIDDNIIDITDFISSPSTSKKSSNSSKSTNSKSNIRNVASAKPHQNTIIKILPSAKNVTSLALKLIPNNIVPKSVTEAAKNLPNTSKNMIPINTPSGANNKKSTLATNSTPSKTVQSSMQKASALIRTAFTTQSKESSSEIIDLDSYVTTTANKKQPTPLTSKAAASATKKPLRVIGKTVIAAEKTLSVIGKTVIAAGKPVSATGKPLSLTGKPASATGKLSATAKPVTAIGKSLSATGKPLSLTGKPASATGKLSATAKPVSTIAKSLSATGIPVRETGTLLSASGKPASATGKSVSAEAKPSIVKVGVKRPGLGGKVNTNLQFPKRKCLEIIELD